MIGKTFGHYRIEEKLGSGGMGVVFRAKDLKLGRDVAVKVLTEELSSDPLRLRRFEQEARSASALNYPNIITIHDFGMAGRAAYIVMELVDGKSLREILSAGPPRLRKMLELAAQVADGLAKAHEAGIVHRDLKPENIMVSRDGWVKILDFGLAKLSPSAETPSESVPTMELTTRPGVVLGTVGYMSPEQASGRSVDFRSDQFSLGSLLYEMATGRRPFHRGTAVQTLSAIIAEEPVPLFELNPDLPPSFVTLVNRCLSKDPEDRYASTRDLARDLRSLRDEFTAASAEALRSTAEKAGRRRRLAAVFALAVLAAAALALISSWRSGRLEELAQSVLPSARRPVAFAERDWLLVADFENLTGEDVFDRSLKTALVVGLEQSRHVNVFPQRRIDEALRRMKKGSRDSIEAATAREIAEREGVRAVLLPSISGVGGVYVLTAVIEDPATGESMRSEMVRARGQTAVLDALDELARRVRQDLGETAAAISERSKPLAKVTTGSLEALKQFSLGIEKHRAAQFKEARLHYETALRLDPSFTAARGSLGMVEFENFDRETGKKHLDDAMRSVDDLTEREKYSLLAFHARAVENDLEKAVKHLETLRSLYPDHSAVHNNLGWFYQQMERYREAIAAYEEAIRLDPDLMLTYDGLSYLYLYRLGEIGKAITHCQRQITRDDRHVQAYDNLGWAYLGRGELALAREAFEKALEINPKYDMRGFFPHLDRYRLGHTLRLERRYPEALEVFEKILEIDPKEFPAHYDAGVVCQMMGLEPKAREHWERYRQGLEKRIQMAPAQAVGQIDLAIVLFRLGELERAAAAARRVFEIDRELHFDYARLLAVQGKTTEALDRLESALAATFRNYVWMKIHPDLESLYGEPRFQQMLARVLKN